MACEVDNIFVIMTLTLCSKFLNQTYGVRTVYIHTLYVHRTFDLKIYCIRSYRRSQYIPMLTHLPVVVTTGTKIGDLEWPWTAKWPSFYVILPNLVISDAYCVKVVDKAITMNNLRLLCLVVNVCRGTARCSRQNIFYNCKVEIL